MNKGFLIKSFITAAFLLTQLTTGLYIAVIPALADHYNTSNSNIMISVSLFLTGFAIGQLFWGILSDIYSRKKLLITAFTLYSLIGFILFAPHNYWVYLSLFCCWGFCAAALTSIGNAIIKAIYGIHAKTVIASIGIAMVAGPIIGPFFGAQLYSVINIPHIVFLILASYGVINTIGLYYALSPDIPVTSDQSTAPNAGTNNEILPNHAIKNVLTNPWFLYYVSNLFLGYGAFMGYMSISAILFEQLGLTQAGYGTYYLLSGFSCIIGSIVNRYFMPFYGPQYLIITGVSFTLVGSILLLFNHTILLPTLLAITVFMFGFGFIIPSSKAGAMVSQPTNIGTAASLMKFLQIIGSVIFTGILSIIDDTFINISLLIMTAAIICLALFICIVITNPPSRTEC